MAPISEATQVIHCGTYAVSYIVGYNAPNLLQANEVLLPFKGPFLCTKYLGEIVTDFQIFFF